MAAPGNECVGISEGCASIRNAPDLWIQGTLIVLQGILSLSPFICSLQYIYKDLYYSYLSVCPLKRSGITGNHIFYLISLM